MAGMLGKVGVDTSQATNNVKRFNKELERPIGIIEDLKGQMADLKYQIEKTADPALLKKMTANYEMMEARMNSLTGRTLPKMRMEHRNLRFAMQSSTEALMGFMFLLSAFDTQTASGETSKFKRHLLEGTQATLGFSFALKSLGGALGRFALPIGIAGGALITILNLIGDINKASKETAEKGLEELKNALQDFGNEEALKLLYIQLLEKKKAGEIYAYGIHTGKAFKREGVLSKEEQAQFEWLEKWLKEYALKEETKKKAKDLWLLQANAVQILMQEIKELKEMQGKGMILTPEGLNIADQLYIKTNKLKELQKSALEERAKGLEEFNKDIEMYIATKLDEQRKEYEAEIENNRQSAEQEITYEKELRRLKLEGITDKYEKQRAEIEKTYQDELANIENMDISWQNKMKLKTEAEIAYKNKLTNFEKEKNNEIFRERYKKEKELNDALIDFAENLANALDATGEKGLKMFMNMLKVAIQIANTMNQINAGEVRTETGVFGILSSLVGLFAFQRGGYTGNLPRQKIAGVVHGGEIVFEKPIVDVYKNELLALREALKGSRRIPSYAGGGFVGQLSPTIYVTGKVDISNGKLFLRKEMPAYRTYEKNKYV